MRKIICHAERSEASRMRPRGCTRDPSRAFRMTIHQDFFANQFCFTIIQIRKQRFREEIKKRMRKVDNILFFVTPEHKSGATKNTQIIDRYYRTSNLTLTSPPPKASGATKNTQIIDRYYRTSNLTLTSPPPKAAASPSGLSICPKRV